MKILINCLTSKKKSGGAFQIANNFVRKTLDNKYTDIEWFYFISSDLDLEIHTLFTAQLNTHYFVFPTQPDFKKTYWLIRKKTKILERKIMPDIIYTISAPSYFSFHNPEVMRFTNPWVTQSNCYSWKSLNLYDRVKKILYCSLQKILIKSTHYFITQTYTTKKGILKIVNIPNENVKVVNNVLPDAYSKFVPKPKIWNENRFDIACVASPVHHKNLDIIPDIIKILKDKGYNNIKFHTTIPEISPMWKEIQIRANKYNVLNSIINHGYCTQKQLSEIYNICQLSLLSTLLEVFSATAIESLFFNLRIVATDFDFNREVLKDAAVYYKPMNAESAADRIIEVIGNEDLRNKMENNSKKRIQQYDNYEKHFNSIVDFLKECALKSIN